jgi:hypothetical protein
MPDEQHPSPAQAEAARLAQLWHRLATQHVALGCSCTMSGISVTLEDFERDIADYFVAEAQRWNQLEVVAMLEAEGPVTNQPQPVRRLLNRLQTAHDLLPEQADWLFGRLKTTLESYARLHGPAPEAPLLGGSRGWSRGYRG